MLTFAVVAAVGRTLTPLLHSKLNLRGFHSMGTPLPPLHYPYHLCRRSMWVICNRNLADRQSSDVDAWPHVKVEHRENIECGNVRVCVFECEHVACVCSERKKFSSRNWRVAGNANKGQQRETKRQWGVRGRCSLAGVLIRSCNPWAKQINKQTANECWQFGKVCDKFGILQLSALPAPRNDAATLLELCPSTTVRMIYILRHRKMSQICTKKLSPLHKLRFALLARKWHFNCGYPHERRVAVAPGFDSGLGSLQAVPIMQLGHMSALPIRQRQLRRNVN